MTTISEWIEHTMSKCYQIQCHALSKLKKYILSLQLFILIVSTDCVVVNLVLVSGAHYSISCNVGT
jgi:hypothetical protein